MAAFNTCSAHPSGNHSRLPLYHMALPPVTLCSTCMCIHDLTFCCPWHAEAVSLQGRPGGGVNCSVYQRLPLFVQTPPCAVVLRSLRWCRGGNVQESLVLGARVFGFISCQYTVPMTCTPSSDLITSFTSFKLYLVFSHLLIQQISCSPRGPHPHLYQYCWCITATFKLGKKE